MIERRTLVAGAVVATAAAIAFGPGATVQFPSVPATPAPTGAQTAPAGPETGAVGNARPIAVGALQVVDRVPVDRALAHWWVFPVSVLFSLVALASGISGALFFSPFFLLVVGLEPAEAIGAGLLTEVFGMGNGLLNYVDQGVVDYATARWLLLGAVPAVVAGAAASHHVPTAALTVVFGAGLVVLGAFLVYYDRPEDHDSGTTDESGAGLPGRMTADRGRTTIETADGERYEYPTCWRPPGVGLAAVGGFVTGLISAGLPEITTTQLVVRCRLLPRVAVATSVVVLAVAALAGAVVHALAATPVWYVVVWSVPGVLVGGTVGTRVSKHVPSDLMEPALGVVFAVVGAIVLGTELLV